ncbi:chemotaxis protein CheB [Desulfotignum phosphitoxidans]|nr:chemotaxis protein CheB [Desulfotignum phosphitoxidans]
MTKKELIQKKTQMKVHQITDGLTIQPNRIYVIPPNKDMAILNGTLQLMDLPQPRGFNLPIDSFFKSLAQDQGADAIGIILSGGTRSARLACFYTIDRIRT